MKENFPKDLSELTKREIILSMILLNPNKSFKLENLKNGLDKLSREYERLNISWQDIDTTLFFYHPYLSGELNLSPYVLNEEGIKIIKREFNNYPASLKEDLIKVSKRVWENDYS